MADVNDLPLLLTGLEDILDRAGELVRRKDKEPREIRHKGRNDLVTSTDLAVEAFLKGQLARLLPESSFLAEESAQDADRTGPLADDTWIIDPLDGTTNFAHGLPFVAISVALWRSGRVVLGGVELPLLGERFLAGLDRGTTLNGERVSVSASESLDQSLLATGFPYAIDKYLSEILEHMGRFLPRTRGIRRPGAAALDLAYVACGRYDGFYERALNPWDTAAGVLLVQEAGGRVSGYAGEPYELGADGILASNGRIHEAMSTVLCE